MPETKTLETKVTGHGGATPVVANGATRIRFSLRWMLIGIAAWAVGLAALVNSTQACVSIVVTLSALAWMTAALFAVLSTGAARAFAIGFALWGLLYVVIVNELWLNQSTKLVTSPILKFIYAELVSERASASSLPEYNNFMTIGHLISAWIFAAAGGWLARFIYARHHHDRSVC